MHNNKMRLLYVYKFNPQDPTEIALRRWLKRVFGGEVRTFTFLPHEKRRNSEGNASEPNPRLLKEAKHFQPTHVLSWVPYFNLAEVIELKKLGAKVTASVNGVSSLSSGNFPDQRAFFEILRELDFYLVPHFPHVEPLRAAGINAVKFPFCFDPDLYRPSTICESFGRLAGIDSVFIGNFGPAPAPQGVYRAALVRAAAKAGKVLLVSDRQYAEYGLVENPNIQRIQLPNFDRQRMLNRVLNLGPFSLGADYFDEVDVYNRGLSNVTVPYSVERDGFTMRPRTWWSLGAGRVFFVERFPDIARLFEDRKEIVLWSSVEEQREEIARLKRDHAARKKIMSAGLAKATAKHTAEVRLRELGEMWSTGVIPSY
jgi:hypothetical protein